MFILWIVGTSLILLGVGTSSCATRCGRCAGWRAPPTPSARDATSRTSSREGAREVQPAALAFLAMRNRIQRQIAQRTAMLAGVSHDLRTPLTRMKLELEMMPEDESGRRAEGRRRTRWSGCWNGYLAFARGEGSEKPEPCDLGALLGEVVRQARRNGGTVDLASRAT